MLEILYTAFRIIADITKVVKRNHQPFEDNQMVKVN